MDITARLECGFLGMRVKHETPEKIQTFVAKKECIHIFSVQFY
jgi:hypothetical protein